MNYINGQECWDMSYDKYCAAIVNNTESALEKRGLKLTPNCVNNLIFGYHPEINVTG